MKNESSSLIRQEKIKNLLRVKHLNEEEKEKLYKLSEKYSDVFYLAGEPLSKTSAVKHQIPIKVNIAPINIRPYRLPEKQVNKK